MVAPRRIADAALVVVCYVLWTGVFLGVAGAVALWLIGQFGSERTASSSTYQVLQDNAFTLLAGSAALAVVAGALALWLNRHLE